MNKLALLSATAAAFGVGRLLANPPVDLQPTTPGTQQAGNINVSGTVLAGTFYGSSGGTTTKVVSGWATSPTGFVFGGDFRTNSVDGRGIFASALSTTGFNYGGDFRSASVNGRGIFGYATATLGPNIGGEFRSLSSAGTGVKGSALAATGTGVGVFGEATSPDGYAGYFQGNVNATGNTTILGSLRVGNVTSPLPPSRVTIREDTNASVAAVHSTNGSTISATFSHGRRAIVGQAEGDGDFCAGVAATAKSTVGSGSFGVYGLASGTGTNYGVFGTANSGTTNYAGYFDGLLYAQAASSSVKSFLIDHPLDPANKFLEHSSVESDERMDIYRGVLKTDAEGFASATVPNWFNALNEDIQYQLTVVGDESDTFVQVKVAQELKNGRFKIRTSAPGIKVNWMVSGRRHDPTSNYYPLRVEREKNADERGKYLAPEAYGKDRSLGMAQGAGVETNQSRAHNPPAQASGPGTKS